MSNLSRVKHNLNTVKLNSYMNRYAFRSLFEDVTSFQETR